MNDKHDTTVTYVHHSDKLRPDKYNMSMQIIKNALSRILLSTAKLNNFIAQIMAKQWEGSREVIAWLQFLKIKAQIVAKIL